MPSLVPEGRTRSDRINRGPPSRSSAWSRSIHGHVLQEKRQIADFARAADPCPHCLEAVVVQTELHEHKATPGRVLGSVFLSALSFTVTEQKLSIDGPRPGKHSKKQGS